MNILVICQYYFPEQFRINDICDQLVLDGHKVTVLTGLPNYPTGVIPQEYRSGRRKIEVINGVDVYRCHEIGRKRGIVGMALNYLSFMVSASIKALTLKPEFDIVFVYQLSPVTMAFPGVILKRRLKKPLYLYCCDIWPESIKNIIAEERSIIYKLIRGLSLFIYHQCDEISVTSKPFIDYFEKQIKIARERISYIPQHAEDLYLEMDFDTSDDVVDFVFMGNIGIAQDIECILAAVSMIKEMKGFKVHFVGDGSFLESSKNLVSKHGLEELVIFHGRHTLEEMPRFYQLADACLLTLKSENLIGLTMPSKLQGYMAAGKPVIGAINGAAQEVIHESGCGICVNASDSNGLAEAMKDFLLNPAKYKNCGENGRRYFKQHFTKRQFMFDLERKLEELIKEGTHVQ